MTTRTALSGRWVVGRELRLAPQNVTVLTIALSLIGCGSPRGGTSAPKDFTLSVSPSSTAGKVGSPTAPVTISVGALNGFTGSVNITLQGIPATVTVSPSASFALAAGSSEAVTFAFSPTSAIGATTVSVLASSGNLSHDAQLVLTAETIVRTYQEGGVLYLESETGSDSARIGLSTAWGGTIVEISLNGIEFVNRHDTGREVQVSFQDGNDPHWFPTLGGDTFNQGTPTGAYALTADSLYTKAQPLQWMPQYFGGGAGHPVAGDVQVEQTITAVANELHTFRAHYKVTHLGDDTHANGAVEFPAVYTNLDYQRLIYFTGASPWTNGAVTVSRFADFPASSPTVYIPEQWAALVDADDMGLTSYEPSPWPYVGGTCYPSSGSGPDDDSSNYLAIVPGQTLFPHMTFEGDIYLIAGDYQTAREVIYRLHESQPPPDLFPPIGTIDTPVPGAVLRGLIPVGGWAFDGVSVKSVEVLMDGAVDGTATYGEARPDVSADFPSAPVNIGYTYSLQTTKYGDGQHILNVRATDSSGNVAQYFNVPVRIANSTPVNSTSLPRTEAALRVPPRAIALRSIPRKRESNIP